MSEEQVSEYTIMKIRINMCMSKETAGKLTGEVSVGSEFELAVRQVKTLE
jgi:hypothetical protein